MKRQNLKLLKLLLSSFLVNLLCVITGFLAIERFGTTTGIVVLVALVLVLPPFVILVLRRWRWQDN